MASLGNMYPNLPGMLVEFKDGGQALRFDETEVNTDSMLILGTAIDGPVMEPIAVDNNSAEALFGSELKHNGSPNGSTLIRAFKEAQANGCQDIRLMRITGSEAVATIKAPSENIEVDTRVDENLGYTYGNVNTEIKLLGTGILTSSIQIFAKGKKLDSKLITLDPDTSNGVKIHVIENTCDAGAILSVEYDYSRQEDVTDSGLVLSAEKQLYLSKTPVDGTVKVRKSGGDYLESELLEVNSKVVTIRDAPADPKKKSRATLSSNETYIVEYKTVVEGTDVETLDEKGNAFIAATGEQKVILGGSPKSKDDLSLYIDDTLVLDKGSYRVDVENKCIFMKREYFDKGSKISASYFATKSEVRKKEIIIKSIFGGEVYNESKIEVVDIKDDQGIATTKAVRLTKPSSKLGTGEQPLVFTSLEFETFGEIVEAINAYSGIFKAETNVPNEKTSSLTYTEAYFRDGDNGIDATKEQLFEALSGRRNMQGFLEKQGAYQLLENYQVDWIVPVGVYADDKLLDRNKNFAYELALFCAVNSYRNKSVYGAIPMKPLQDTSLASVQAHAKYLASFKNQYFMKDNRGSVITDGQGNPIDLGKFISVIAGPTINVNHQVVSLREANGAVSYVSFNTVLLPQSAPTNKKLPGSIGVRYNFSNAQLNEIAGNRLVCFGKKFSTRGQALQGAFVVDGPTSARSGSEYGRLSTLKVMREVSDHTREVADPYIGEANTIEQRNSLSAALSKRYDSLVTSGVILDYTFNLVATQMDQVLGQASLELGIVAPQELRKITTVMGLKR